MNFCILRTKKLTSMGSIAGSAKHTFREISAPNVDAARTHLNWTAGAKSSEEVREAINALLPTKRRKDAVLCIEYLITASPEWLRSKSEKERVEYFNGAIGWLRRRHGKDNIVCLNLQKDETSEHLVAYIVPITTDGRLSAKDFLGGRNKLTAMQTDFWHQVGRPVGLERGLEGSTAKHITAKQYSAAIARNPTIRPPLRPEPSVVDRITGRANEMEQAFEVAEAEFIKIVEQGRNEVLLMKKFRKEQILDLTKLRADRAEMQVLQKDVEFLTLENGQLRANIKRQAEFFGNQIGVLRLLLTHATERISQLLAFIGVQKKVHLTPLGTRPNAKLRNARPNDLARLLPNKF